MQKIRKIFIVFLVLILLFSNLSPSIVSIAIYTNQVIENQNNQTQNENVEFDAKLVSEQNSSYWLISDVKSKEVFIDMAINLKNQGYLKNAVISFASDDGNSLNYRISGEVIGSNIERASENEIVLNKINAGTNSSIVIPIEAGKNLSAENIEQTINVTLKAEYVTESGETEKIEKTIKLNLGWTENGSLNLQTSLEKLIQVNENEFLVQTQIQVEKEKQQLPVKETKIEVKDILIKNMLPKEVYVLKNDVEEKIIWNYAKEENKVIIENYENKNIQEYSLVSIFEGNIENNIAEEKNILTFDINANRKIYAGKENVTEITGMMFSNLELKEKYGTEISFEMKNQTQEIEKSKIYANQLNEEKIEIPFTKELNINISRIRENETIEILDNVEFLENEESRIEIETEYKKIAISKRAFEEILGTNGLIEIFKETGEKISEIRSINYIQAQTEENSQELIGETKINVAENDTESENILNENTTTENNFETENVDENQNIENSSETENQEYILSGEYEVLIPEGIYRVIIKISAPIAAGNLKIREEKIIKDLNCSKLQIAEAKNIVSSKYLNNQSEARVALKAAITNASIEVNTQTITNVNKNENVEIKIVLNNHNRNSDLYENPVFEILMPENVNGLEVNSSNIVCPDGLEIKTAEAINRNGRFLLRVELSGVQTNFNYAEINNGTNIILSTNIYLDTLKANQNSKLEMFYLNKGATNYQNEIEWNLPDEITEEVFKNVNGYSSVEMNCVGPTGMIAIEKTNNYNEVGSSIYSVNGETLTGKIKAHVGAKTVKEEIIVLNNTDTKVTGVVILGRVPNPESKQIESEELLGTTINTIMKTGIINENANIGETTIYYSENPNAGRNVIDINNGWKLEVEDYSKVKSYLIVIKEKEVMQGETLKYSYEYEIPANIEYDNKIKGTFAVYYNSHKSEGLVQGMEIATSAELETGTGPKLEIELSSSITESTVIREGQTFRYTAKVTNTGSEEGHNVQVTIPIPTGLYYLENGVKDISKRDYIEVIEILPVGETKEVIAEIEVGTVQFTGPDGKTIYESETGYYIEELKETELCLNDVLDEEGKIKEGYSEKEGKIYEIIQKEVTLLEMQPTTIENKATVFSNEIPNEIESNIIKIQAKKSELIVNKLTKKNKDYLVSNDEVTYNLTLKNGTKIGLENGKIIVKIDNGLKLVDAYVTKKKIKIVNVLVERENTLMQAAGNIEIDDKQGSTIGEIINNYIYDEESKIVILDIGRIEPEYSYTFTIKLAVNELEEGIYEKNVSTLISITADNIDEYKTEPVTERVIKPKATISQTISNENEYIKEGAEFTYNVLIQNESDITIKGVNILDNIPKELKVSEIKFVVDGQETSSLGTNTINKVHSVLANQTIEMIICCRVKKLAQGENFKEITNYAEIVSDDLGLIRSNKISFKIEADENYEEPKEDYEEPEEPLEPSEPDNPNEPNEPDKPTTGKYQISGTVWIDENENGKRETAEKILSNVEMILVNSSSTEIARATTNANGEYTFSNIESGTYFVISKHDNTTYKLTEYSKNGVSNTVNSDFFESNGKSITNSIQITNASVGDIDLGLVQREQFDLRLEKYVKRITIQNEQGTQIYNYNNQFAKLDIAAKHINGTKVLIEYEIVITNDGDIAGQVKKIVDYIPNNMTFNSNLNENWYTGSNGALYNSELENIEIAPGESKEVTLILSKTMTGENTGIVTNSAEIAESYNALGIVDRNSVPGNKAQKEDDYSTADSMISVKTGKEFLVIAIIAFVISVILIVAPIVSKKIIERRRV